MTSSCCTVIHITLVSLWGPIDSKSILVQAMACLALSHSLPQCRTRSIMTSGLRFNIKMSYQYRKSHCGNKTVVRSSYLHNGISYTALRAGGVLSSGFGRAGGCQTCGTHISVTAWRMFSIRSSVELSRPVVVHCYGHLPICPIWACPWVKNLSNLPQIGSRLCGTHISETAGWIYPI